MEGWKKGLIALLAGISMMALSAGLSSAAEKVEQVVVGLNMELTGAGASSTIPASYGHFDFYTHMNEKGGFTYTDPVDKKVHRVKYKIVWADNGFSVARSMTNVKRFIDEGAKLILTA
jgi:hypothetical protein